MEPHITKMFTDGILPVIAQNHARAYSIPAAVKDAATEIVRIIQLEELKQLDYVCVTGHGNLMTTLQVLVRLMMEQNTRYKLAQSRECNLVWQRSSDGKEITLRFMTPHTVLQTVRGLNFDSVFLWDICMDERTQKLLGRNCYND